MSIKITNFKQYIKDRVNITDKDCWEWTNCKDVEGYGITGMTYKGNKYWRSHRLSFVIFCNEITLDRPLICHHCDNPSCVNPKHLFAGTVQDNVDDKIIKKRARSWVNIKKHGEQTKNTWSARLGLIHTPLGIFKTQQDAAIAENTYQAKISRRIDSAKYPTYYREKV